MGDNLLDLTQVHIYLLENGGKVKNRDVVRYFKSYLTDPITKDENRARFKSYINTLATTRTEGDDKIILLKTKYSSSDSTISSCSSTNLYSPQYDPRNSVGIPISQPEINLMDLSPSRQPPPYRPPPPPPQGTPSSSSLDAMSIGSVTSLNELPKTPQAPPRERKRESDRIVNEVTPQKSVSGVDPTTDDKTLSVKERTQKFNRLASVEDELSPRPPKSAEKKPNRGADEDDSVSLTPLEPKKCMEWYVTASRGDYQELIKLANTEPRLVNKKDPFTYTVLHWGAKYGNPDIIKIFAGKYNVDVNGKTNGGYTPLHISAQFGHKDVFKLLIEVYKADPNIRDYSGRTADYYFFVKEQKEGQGVSLRSEYGTQKSRHGKSRSKSFRNKTISAPTSIAVSAPSINEFNKVENKF